MSEAAGGFGSQLRARRRSSGLSQEELAERSGLNARTIRNLERGQARWPYQDTLHRLADALELRDAARAEFITAPGHRPALGAGAVSLVTPRPADDAGVPRQLPAGVRHFTDRKTELDFLTALLDEPPPPGGAVAIAAISGGAGVGKSALAVHWAHRHAGCFPDGQLYADLRGFDAAGPPVDAATVLRRFLDALAVPPTRTPADLDALAGLYRSTLAGRRMLIVLDNARDASQVRPLLPAEAGCMILITSRSQLTDLIALEGADPLTIGLLSPDEARDLLARRLGAGRVAAEQPEADELITLCGHLPLALAIAAARAAVNPSLPLGTLAAGLRGARRRLEMLSPGTGRADVRAAFSCSYDALTAPAARLFRLLAAHPGPDFSLPAAASIAAVDPAQARRVLAELTGTHLVAEPAPGRYALPGLLRAHAAELHAARDDPGERRLALRRMLDHYLHNGIAAAARCPAAFPLPLSTMAAPAPGLTQEDMAAQASAVAWFAAEHQVIMAAAQAADGFDTHTLQLPLLLHPYLCSTGRWRDSVATGLLALAAARRLGDLSGQGHAHCCLGQAYRCLGNPAKAESHLSQALTLFQRIDHPQGQGLTHAELQALRHHQRRDTDALYHAGRALAQYRIAGCRCGETKGLNNLGWCHVVLGDPVKGLTCLDKAATMQRDAGDNTGLAYTLDSVGYAHHCLGEYEHAIRSYTDAESLSRELGVRPLRAVILDHLGDAHHCAENTPAARRAWHQALDIRSGLDQPDLTGLRAKLAR